MLVEGSTMYKYIDTEKELIRETLLKKVTAINTYNSTF